MYNHTFGFNLHITDEYRHYDNSSSLRLFFRWKFLSFVDRFLPNHTESDLGSLSHEVQDTERRIA